MIRALALIVVVGFMALALFGTGGDGPFPEALSTLSFGFLLLAAYLVGDVLSRIGLPRITGYILTGIAFGPHVLEFISRETVDDLKLIDDLALTFIALAAGGELRIADLRARRRSILLTLLFLTTFVFLGVGTFTVAGRGLLPFLDGRPIVQVLVVGGVLGTFAVARSPSSAIAIIRECRARGPFTETVLGVTVLMDVLVIVVFAVVVSLGEALVAPGTSFDVFFVMLVFVEIAVSIVAGVAVGWVIAKYITHVAKDLALFILSVAFLVTFGARQFAHFLDSVHELSFHLEPMLICITAGFWVQNFSPAGEELMEKIDRSSLPIFVVFFSLTGAALNIEVLGDTWVVALLLVAVRAALIWIAGWLGATLARDPPRFRRMAGLSYITQAGVSLGLAGIVMDQFPDWGTPLAATIIAVITVNQVVGLVAFKLALSGVGEAGAARKAG